MRLGTKSDKSDPYVTAFLEDYRLLKTRVVDDDLNPVSTYSYMITYIFSKNIF